MEQLSDFDITANGAVSTRFLSGQITTFLQAAEFVKRLPYKRNADKEDLVTILMDKHGTCSTKHALLKQLAIENNQHDFHLVLGIFKMSAINTPKISDTIKNYELDYIPEAHNYLRFKDRILDYTFPDSVFNDFEQDLLEEVIIQPEQITQFKIAYHMSYLKKWLKENGQIPYSFEQIWNIREQCIQDLSKNSFTDN